MNAAASIALGRVGEVHYVGPVDPPPSLTRRVASKFRRTVGSQADFFFFSERRLKAIAREVDARSRTDAEFDFFHGFTPWVLTEPRRPYFAWSDCTFHDYMNIYHRREHFRAADLERIEQAEAAWLRNADCVMFTSDWAAVRAVRRYGLDQQRVRSVRIFGEVEMPERDTYTGDREFAFVSTNFAAKGGPVVLAAFREVRKQYPDARLTVVGDRPRRSAGHAGVTFTGYLQKEIAADAELFRGILGRARSLVHPTHSDIAPLLIVEAGYFGCPAIASRLFAIPELVDDGRTGLLLDEPSAIGAVADAMVQMLGDDESYSEMRRACWEKLRREHSKSGFETALISSVRSSLSVTFGVS